MIRYSDGSLGPFLGFLLGWSIRWGLAIVPLALWFRVRPPRRAADRHLLCAATLVAGLILPLAPTWTAPGDWSWLMARVPARPTLPASGPAPAADLRAPSRPTDQPTEPPSPVASPLPEPTPAITRSAPVVVPTPPRPREWPGLVRCGMLLLGLAWMLGTGGSLIRLVVGRTLLARLRRSSRPVAAASAAVFEQTRREAMAANRRVEIARHPGVGSPVVLGGRIPLILVPDDWDGWPVAAQRACLLHELGHLARRDDRWKLLAELARVPFWFHPGVVWLAARLDREAELACDEAAVARGVAPRELARLLLACARRPHRLDPSAFAPGRRALSFFTPATVSTRITRLLEDDMPRSLTRPPRSQVFGLVATVAAVALAVGGARVRATEPPAFAPPPPPAQQPASARPAAGAAGSFAVIVRDQAGRPVAGATVIAGVVPAATPPDVTVARTGVDGIARFDRQPQRSVRVIAFKSGASFTSSNLLDETGAVPTELVLPDARALTGTVVDESGQPVEGSEVCIRGVQGATPGTVAYLFSNVAELGDGTPIEEAIVARSGRDGRFRFDSLPADAAITLVASAPGKATGQAKGATTASTGDLRVVLAPEARVAGRVVARVADVAIAGRSVVLQGIFEGSSARVAGRATTDAAGRFEIGGLARGRADLILDGVPADGPWTFAAARNVPLTPGATSEARIEIVAGTVVAGTVTSTDGEPLAGVTLAAYGARNPMNGSASITATTDPGGAYRFRLPPGNATIVLAGRVAGYSNPVSGKPDLDIVVPESPAPFAVRPILLAPGAKLLGRIVDATGAPIPRAGLSVASNLPVSSPDNRATVVAADDGTFRLDTQADGQPIPMGRAVMIQVRLADGREFDATVVPNRDNAPVTIKLPSFAAGGPRGPERVAKEEIAGVVVDPQGRPLEGVLVHPISWVPNFQTRSDAAGRFRIKVPEQEAMEVRVSREGYEPREFLRHPVGQAGWVVVLDNRTYFEGRVLAPDGSPVADAPIRADSGPKQLTGGRMGECPTDGRSAADGRYRLYVEPGMYEFQVRVPGSGVLRLARQAIATDEVVPLDLHLVAGVDFEARVVDSLTEAPVAGYPLEDWRNPTIRGSSDAAGVVRIAAMLPGPFQFSKARDDTKYARWWSDACSTEHSRFQAANRFGFQRNFDSLDFALQAGMAPVTIRVEPATTIRGVVIDPDGQPVAGATVAPALTGSGNSLTGDTRFSVATGPDGTYTMKLPASGAIAYNLVAHDGKYRETRQWGNEVTEPFKTTPGQVLDGVNLRLTRPATVRGRVVDAATGQPIAGREVRASAADKRENRYYDPTTKTEADGTFTLRCIRPGEQFIQAAPFWLDAPEAPGGTSATMTLGAEETREGVVLKSTARER